ncbi:MAG: macro domain-containing protein [Deltaproteobacteria bacterium]|nr:macro domain-containing protein [Deltaproteobacteria bacterium]
MTTKRHVNWTNRSVTAFAKDADPLDAIKEAAQALVLEARESGWEGPPFNPIYLAQMLGVQVEANSSVADARLAETEDGPKIEFNPRQVRERVRFSIAHEVAHLLFADWNEQIRNRATTRVGGDDWQLEMLCNLAASEFVLPIGSLDASSTVPPLPELMQQRRLFDVSTEAFLLRLARVASQPIGVFFASPIAATGRSRRYRVDYYVSSPTASRVKISRRNVPPDSVIQKCTAIGHTDYAIEDWVVGSPTVLECVGVPAYPRGGVYPRVAALVRFEISTEDLPRVRFLHGDVLHPGGSAPRFLCQLVNDRAKKWGGGVARKVAHRFPRAEVEFSDSLFRVPRGERLGSVIYSRATDDITVASMIAQEGFGPSLLPRIRYAALERCLKSVAARALAEKASIHMPRIGTGAAGGDWATIEEMLDDAVVRAGLSVTVYDPPPPRQQFELF